MKKKIVSVLLCAAIGVALSVCVVACIYSLQQDYER